MKRNIFAPLSLVVFLILTGACRTTTLLQPPKFEHDRLVGRFFNTQNDGHYPLTVQRGLNKHPTVTDDGHMFYTANRDGSSDIWMRDLKSTVNISIVRHDAGQHSPAVTSKGDKLVFVSADKDAGGDLRILEVPGSPARIVRSILNGNETPNLWRASENLSQAIQKYFEKDPNPACRGAASETDPIWSPDGKKLIYVSDRCTRDGSRNLWLLEMDGIDAKAAPRRLTTKGGEQPALSRDGRTLAYVAFREKNRTGRLISGGEIFVMDLAGGGEQRIKLPLKAENGNGADPDANGGNGPYLYHSPALSPDGRILYYVSVREDSNNNGQLDLLDKSAVYRIDLAGAALGVGREFRLVEAGTSISGLSYSNLVGGSLLYASNLFNSVNIYLMQFQGVIPRQRNIDEQYRRTFEFATASLKRYILALDAVKFYYGREPAWALYEGRVLLDKLRRLRAAGNRPRRLRRVSRELDRVIARSPFAGLLKTIEGLENRGESTEPVIQAFLRDFPTRHGPKYQDKARRLVNAAALELLARVQLKERAFAPGLETARKLNKEFPDYNRRYQVMLLEAKLALETNPRVPEVLNRLLRENGRPLSRADQAAHPLDLTSVNVRTREAALSMVYNFYNKKYRPADALKLADEQIRRTDLHPLLRVSLKLVRARAWYDLKRYSRSLDLAKKAMEGDLVGYARSLAIPPPDMLRVKTSAELLKLAAKADGRKKRVRLLQQADLAARTYLYQKSGMYVLGFRVIAFSLEKLGRNTEAYFAKLEYGGQYRPEYGVVINVEEYLNIIAESERTINLYLRTARSVVKTINASRPVPNKVLGNLGLGQLGLSNLTNWSVDIASLDREVLSDFCDPGSRSVKLIGTLGLKVFKRYQKFCAARPLIASGRPVPSKMAKEASQLLYLASNANATILNIMFLHIKGLNLFHKLYRERAVHYHRAKIDIAIEQNQSRLEWERQRFQVLNASDLQQLVGVGDPFDSKAFKLLESGYTLPRTDKEAREFGDLSMLYGYAYTLIRKSVQREQFYDGLQKAGVFFTEQQLKQFKKSILEDMKRAEYRLRYIIFTDPRNTDAYLLLGWLYQYLDTRKSNLIKIPPGYIERIYNYVSGTAPATPTDGRFYNDFYRVYFPGRLLETNVELYRQALNMKSGDPSAARDRSLLDLNLANNYFNLLNFKRSVRHYRDVSAYLERTGNPIFDNYTQEALFYYNHGRALFYQGDSAAAAEKFLRAYKIYDEFERKPLHKEFTAMSYRRLAGAGVADPKSLRLFIRKQKQLLEKDKQVRSKMALIAAMLGMVYWEAGRYDESILFYRDAERRLYRGGKADKSSVVEPGNLRNFIALAYQSKRDFVNSERSAKRAQEFVEKVGLSKNDLRFQPQSLTSRILGCLLNYGEDFSVIGDGRNPFGFSTLRQYELSLGIRLENKVLRGDLDGVTELLKARRKVFRKEDGNVALGKEGQVTTYNNEAFFNFRAGRYTRSLIGFRQAAKQALAAGNLRGFRLNLTNRFHAMFAYFESGRARPGRAIALIQKGLRDIRDQEINYAAQVKVQYIEQRTKENADFEFGKIDEINIREKIRRDLFDLVVIQGLIHYYHGRIIDQRAKNRTGVSLARGHYLQSLKKLDAALKSAGPNRRIASLRIRLNRTRVLISLGRLFEAERELAVLKERTFEFNLLREQWEALWAGAALFKEIHEFRKTKSSRARAARDVDEAVKILRAHPQIHFGSDRKMENFYDFAAAFYIRSGESDKALRVLEQKWEHYLQREYLRYPLVFADLKFNAKYNRLRFLTEEARMLERRESALRIRRADVEKLRKRKAELRGEIAKLRGELLGLKPAHGIFLRFTEEPRPNLNRDQILLRLFRRGDSLSAWAFTSKGGEFKTLPAEQSSTEGAKALEKLYGDLLPSGTYKDVFLIADGTAPALNPAAVLKKARPNLPRAVFTTRISDNLTGFQDRVSDARAAGGKLNLFNVDTSFYRKPPPKTSTGFKLLPFELPFENPFESSFEKREAEGKKKKVRSFYSEHYDIVGIHAPTRGGVFPVVRPGHFDSRLWLSRSRNSSLVLLNRPKNKDPREAYRRQAGIYEVLRATGVGTVVFRKKISPEDLKTLRARAGAGTLANGADMVFGSSGFKRDRIRPVLLELHGAANNRGRRLEEKKQFERAGESFSVAVSLLRELPGARGLNLDARLNLVRAAMSGRRFQRAIRELELILKEFKDADFNTQLRVNRLAVRSLYGAGKPADAGIYLAAFMKKFPRRGRPLQREAAVLSFLEKLNRRKYSVSEFEQDMRAIRPFPTSGVDAEQLMREFARRGMYGEAVSLAASLRRRPNLRNTVDVFLYELGRDAKLLNIPGVRRNYAAPAGMKGAAALLKLAEAGNWELYDKTVVDLPGEKGDPVLKFRRRMFTQWKTYKQKSYLSLQEIAGVRVGGLGLTAYHAVTPLERSMLYRMFISAIPADPDLQVGKFLGDLIQAERGPNPERGARMAMGAAMGFLRIGDVSSALGFLKLYGDAAKRALNRPLDQEAGTGLALLTALGDGAFKTRVMRRRAYLGTTKPAALRARWSRRLRAGGRGDVVDLYASVARNAPINEFISTLSARRARRLLPELRIAAALRRRKAEKDRNWPRLLNLSFYAQSLRNYSARMRVRAAGKPPAYADLVKDIMAKIPPKQVFIAMVDQNASAYFMRITRGGIAAGKMQFPGRLLRGRMHEFLDALRRGRPASIPHEELAWAYRSLLGFGKPRITYFWFEGIHVFAPLAPRRGDRVYQVLDPAALAGNTSGKAGEFGGGEFRVRARGSRDWARLGRFMNAKELQWQRRVAGMESIAIGARGASSSSPLHFISEVYPGRRGEVQLPAGLSDSGPWFLASNRLLESPDTEVENMGYLMTVLARRFQGPGVLVLRKPRLLSHPYFVKFYYNRASPARSIELRYINAFLRMRRTLAAGTVLYGYRLVTPKFIKDS